MIFYVLIFAFISGLAAGAGGMNWWKEASDLRKERAMAKAEAIIQKQTEDAIQAGENHLIDMQAAFEDGQSKAKVVEKTVYLKGQTYVQNTPAYNNPVCVVDAAGVSIINSQIAGLRAAAVAALGLGSVPYAGADSGNLNVYGATVPEIPGQPSPATGVRTEAPKPDNPNAVPGQGVQGHPKPKPAN